MVPALGTTESGGPVEKRLIKSTEELGDLVLPWYVDADGSNCNYDIPGARRLSVGEAVGSLDGPLGGCRGLVEQKARELRNCGGIELPAYSREGKLILLDGCHRALALMSLPALPTIEVYCVAGPDDPVVLWDLAVPN